MDRRLFTKIFNLGIVSILTNPEDLLSHSENNVQKNMKNWAWYSPEKVKSSKETIFFLKKLKSAGIDAILPNVYNSWSAQYQSKHLPSSSSWLEETLPLAKDIGLELHAWIWTMPCNIKEIQKTHPEWFVVNRNNVSALEKPAYVNYYNFMCPNRDGVKNFILKNVEELCQIKDLDGIHFDYIRFPDVILTKKLQNKYKIVQDKEYPEYDYCYCSVCRSQYKKLTGIDPLEIEDPQNDKEWLQFRYDSITNFINHSLVPVVKKYSKTATAAVFPNWKDVRQEWAKWAVDAVMPMLYNKIYNKGNDWIKDSIVDGVKSLKEVQLFSGLQTGPFSADELIKAMETSFNAGANGVSLFNANNISKAQWKALSAFLKN